MSQIKTSIPVYPSKERLWKINRIKSKRQDLSGLNSLYFLYPIDFYLLHARFSMVTYFTDRNLNINNTMKLIKINFLIAGGLLLSIGLQSCDSDNDDSYALLQPTALVTVCPQPDKSVVLQLDDATQLIPVNIKKSPYGNKEVRALVNYSPVSEGSTYNIKNVNVNWIDSIRTKMPIIVNAEDDAKFANDPVEIVRDWVTVAEDGYLTLRLRTIWGSYGRKHAVDLIHDGNTTPPLTFELRHDASGDVYGNMGDALIAFNLNEIIKDLEKPVKIKLKWHSFSGDKSTEFTLDTRAERSSVHESLPQCNSLLQ